MRERGGPRGRLAGHATKLNLHAPCRSPTGLCTPALVVELAPWPAPSLTPRSAPAPGPCPSSAHMPPSFPGAATSGWRGAGGTCLTESRQADWARVPPACTAPCACRNDRNCLPSPRARPARPRCCTSQWDAVKSVAKSVAGLQGRKLKVSGPGGGCGGASSGRFGGSVGKLGCRAKAQCLCGWLASAAGSVLRCS